MLKTDDIIFIFFYCKFMIILKEIDVNIFIVVVDISKPFLSSLSCLATYFFLIQSTDGYKMTVSTQYTIVF